MATVDLTTKFLPKVDEQFTAESKRSLVTNQDFKWDGAATVRVYKVSTGKMNDYARNGDPATGSRFGEVEQLNATTYPLTIEKDRSFTFVIDKLDEDETQQQLSGATALARQNREVVIPEVDAYTYGVMCTNAGTKPAAVELTAENIYDEICKAGALMDEAGAPETGRVLVVTPEIYRIMISLIPRWVRICACVVWYPIWTAQRCRRCPPAACPLSLALCCATPARPWPR